MYFVNHVVTSVEEEERHSSLVLVVNLIFVGNRRQRRNNNTTRTVSTFEDSWNLQRTIVVETVVKDPVETANMRWLWWECTTCPTCRD